MGTMATATGSHGKKNNNKKHTIMDKEKKKKGYESPTVDWTLVELESPICVGSMTKPIEKPQEFKAEVDKWEEVSNEVTFE